LFNSGIEYGRNLLLYTRAALSGVRVPTAAGNIFPHSRLQTDPEAQTSLLSNGYQELFSCG